MTQPRDTFQGTANDVAERLAPFCNSRDWLQYGAQVNPKALHKEKKMLKVVKALSENWNLQKRKVLDAMEIIMKQRRETWAIDLEPKHEKLWIQEHCNRLRWMCRHMAKAELGRRAWCLKLLEEPDEPEPEEPEPSAFPAVPSSWESPAPPAVEDGSGVAPAVEDGSGAPAVEDGSIAPAVGDGAQAEDAAEYYYGWCPRKQQAYRCPVGSTSKREYTEDVYELADARPEDTCWARFSSGEVFEINDLTVEELREIKNMETLKPGRFWEGEEANTKKKVWLMKSKFQDGIALYMFRTDEKKKDGKAQILQLLPKDIGGSDTASIQKGAAMITNLAERICNGKIEDSSSARRAARDQLLHLGEFWSPDVEENKDQKMNTKKKRKRSSPGPNSIKAPGAKGRKFKHLSGPRAAPPTAAPEAASEEDVPAAQPHPHDDDSDAVPQLQPRSHTDHEDNVSDDDIGDCLGENMKYLLDVDETEEFARSYVSLE